MEGFQFFTDPEWIRILILLCWLRIRGYFYDQPKKDFFNFEIFEIFLKFLVLTKLVVL